MIATFLLNGSVLATYEIRDESDLDFVLEVHSDTLAAEPAVELSFDFGRGIIEKTVERS